MQTIQTMLIMQTNYLYNIIFPLFWILDEVLFYGAYFDFDFQTDGFFDEKGEYVIILKEIIQPLSPEETRPVENFLLEDVQDHSLIEIFEDTLPLVLDAVWLGGVVGLITHNLSFGTLVGIIQVVIKVSSGT